MILFCRVYVDFSLDAPSRHFFRITFEKERISNLDHEDNRDYLGKLAHRNRPFACNYNVLKDF